MSIKINANRHSDWNEIIFEKGFNMFFREIMKMSHFKIDLFMLPYSEIQNGQGFTQRNDGVEKSYIEKINKKNCKSKIFELFL